ncbi:membrane fusion protein (multidrug efflux system) [Archangium gephyra]|uniref:Co/Zn/Cd efflux system membrane fusion protein n=1 Tax=Archangium gephyra TaxID=48 RepID=A0AAC8Q8I5_9BACT|nr:efflux RND transporter periplasmic adaptor subunit [Archangium gephyra]AKJ03033.1 Putative Co/Zn/Cd efflux system membrane fusion protein [Archangium gephyra]REG25155.1 membrane fusion protein (multidrug efflux system) [Archangium gephyra]
MQKLLRNGRTGKATTFKVLVAGGLVLTLGAGCGSRVDAAQKPGAQASGSALETAVKADTVEVGEAKVPRFLTLTGSLSAYEDSDVAAGAMGKVMSVHVERGSVVRKGDVLVKLDSRSASASLEEARAQLALAKSQQALADAECERNQKLFEGGTVSTAEHDRAQAQCRNAAAQAAATTARMTLLEINATDATIRAPFDGVVSERAVSVGEYVRQDSKVVTLVALDPLRLELTVPESSAAFIRKDQEVEFTLTAAPNLVHKTKVSFVGAGLRRGTRDLVVEALVPNKDRTLLPGQFATAKVQLGEQQLPIVPRTAVLEDGARRKLFVVSDGRLEERVVQVSESAADSLGVMAGVRVGERVVAVAREDLRDGQKLQ